MTAPCLLIWYSIYLSGTYYLNCREFASIMQPFERNKVRETNFPTQKLYFHINNSLKFDGI